MITSYNTYRQYIKADIATYGLQHVSLYNWLCIDQLRFQMRLRRREYLTNCCRWRMVSRAVLEAMNHSLAVRLGVTIPKNVFGPGLCLVHRSTVVVSPLAHVGANCRIHRTIGGIPAVKLSDTGAIEQGGFPATMADGD